MYWIAVSALLCATLFDLRRHEIPDWVSVVLFVVALSAKFMGWSPISWGEFGLGFGVAFVGSATLFYMGGLGGGDVKLLTALGACLGVKAFLPFVLLTAVIGGGVALAVARKGASEIAYAPVMLAGLLGLLPLLWLAP